MDLTELTLDKLFNRQATLHAQHKTAILTRNQFTPTWDLWNSVANSLMEELADTAEEISRRIADMQAEAAASREAEPADVLMVCTACRKPVKRPPPGQWDHINVDDYMDCPRPVGQPVKAMVAAGNESVPRA